MAAKDGRYWMNLINFAVEVKNINQETGAEFNDLSSMLSMIPKATYTKRQSNPIPQTGMTLGAMQDTENFVLQEMSGAADLFSVYPISVQSGGRDTPGRMPLVQVSPDNEIFANPKLIFTQSASIEGDLLGVQVVNVTRADYHDGGVDDDGKTLPQAYRGTGLSVKRVGGKDRPLELSAYQGSGNRVVVVGFTVDGSPSNAPISFSSFKWDPNVGYWVLWDDYEQAPRYAPEGLSAFTPVSTLMPIMIVSGVYTKKEQQELHEALMLRGQNEFGQPFGDPKGFGDFLKKAIGVITIIGKVAGFLGTLL